MWRLLARLMRLTPGTGVGDAHLLTGIKEPYPRGCTETEKEALFQLLWGESGRFADTVARASEPDALRIARRAEQQLRQLRAEGRRATAIEVARELGESWEVIPAECRRCIADQVCLTCEEVGGSLDTHLLLTLRDASQERKDAVILATGAGTELKTLAELGEVADTAASQLLAQKIGEVFREPTAREALSIVAGNGVAQGALRHWRQLAADNLERLQDQKEADQVIESAEADPTAACHTTALALARLYGVLRDLPPSGFFTGVGDSLVALAAGRVDHSGYLATLLEPVVDALHRHRDEATETARSFVEQLLEAIRRQQDAEPNVRELCRAVYSVAEGFGPDLWNNWNGHMAFAGALAWYPSPWVYDLITRVGELPQGHPVVDAMARHLSPMGDIQLEPATFCPVFGRLRPDVASSLLLSIMQRISFDAMGSLLSSLVEAPPALEIDALPALTSLFERIRGEMGANRRDIEDLASTCRALARALLARVPQATLAGSLCDLAEEWLQSLEEGEPVRGLAATSLVAIREQVRAADHGLCKKIAVRAEALVLANAALDAGSQRALASVVGSYRYCVPKGTLKAQKTTVEFLSDDLAIRLLRDKAGIEY
ncbi:MAG TPA: hypothetical protein DGT21_20760 [Armatimonadetes bacterium]|nr:hypothetical protein [Armatimonadota bacterium]